MGFRALMMRNSPHRNDWHILNADRGLCRPENRGKGKEVGGGKEGRGGRSQGRDMSTDDDSSFRIFSALIDDVSYCSQ